MKGDSGVGATFNYKVRVETNAGAVRIHPEHARWCHFFFRRWVVAPVR